MVKLKKKGSKSKEMSQPLYTDLRQVMDYKRPLSIFYSGVEYESYLDILYDLGVRNFLMSYEYLKGKGHSQLKKYSDMHLFIDSGAYTYITNPEFESYTVEQWESQIQEYLSWAKKYKDSIFAIADLDLQYLVGNEKVYEWRKKYFEPFMLETGIPVCFIYHEEGLDQWEYMCKRYPYIGVSLNVDGNVDEADLRQKFKIAEKYNTLIQGMASTRTGLLTQYPFYTVDSTTWNVGLKYGEISVWTGTKMSRIKKTDFETKAFPIIQRYSHKFDLDLIREEDKTEMIRVNAYAFIEAEKYINDRLKNRMYWFKERAIKVDLDNLPDDFYPTPEWVLGGDTYFDVKEKARSMNINPELEKVDIYIADLTAVMNWDNPDYESVKEFYSSNDFSTINSLHDMFINRIVSSPEEKVEDLQKFYTECLTGERDTLLQLGTNFDRIVKEREDYITDDEEETVDVSSEEVRSKLQEVLRVENLLTDGDTAPEVDELDEEIFSKANIVPIRDGKGRLVKGQTTIRKPKKVYSSKYPKIACDTCFAANNCPEYKSSYACAFNKMFERFDTRNMEDIIAAMQGMVAHNLARMQRAMVLENLSGGFDPNVTGFINQNMNLLNNLKSMYEHSSAEVLRQSRVVKSDGSTEETIQVTNPQSGGILERLFGGNNTSETKEKEIEEPKTKSSVYENLDIDE